MTTPPTLRRGSVGDAVLRLQRLLNFHEFLIGVDGVFGEQTEHAVRDYQAAHNLDVDGVVGPHTWAMLIGSSGESNGLAFPRQVEAWRSLVDQLRGDLDLDFLLAWIQHESGGNPCSTGIIRDGFCVEAGIGQLYFENKTTRSYGVTSDELRAMCSGSSPVCSRPPTEAERHVQVQSLVDMARDYRSRSLVQLGKQGLVWDQRDLYRLTKLQHALPAVASAFIPALKPVSWALFKISIETMNIDKIRQISPPVARFFGEPLRKVLANANDVGGVVNP